ncbi:cytochrome c oxidase subunit 3-like [Oscarella lobularis]|uniref:cytochrome c oxidase subunit 3-like n=1 Tax=Oscarella lobularis TaxID=121494 RepID=UPI003313EF6B
MSHQYHPYHLVDPNPWPYIGGCGALFTTIGAGTISGKRKEAIIGLTLTVLLDILFTSLQAMEYYEAPFAIIILQ